MKKISDSTIDALRNISPDMLVSYGVIDEAPNHKGLRGYCCPLCGSGTGQNHNGHGGDGAGEFDSNNRFYCHACNNSDVGGHKLSTIDLFAISRDLQHSTFPEKCREMAKTFGIGIDEDDFTLSARPRRRQVKIEPPKPEKPPIDPAELDCIRADLLMTSDNYLRTFVEKNCGGLWRGFTADFLIAHGCKFIFDWRPPKSRVAHTYATRTERIIIPAGADNYLARFVGDLSIYDCPEYAAQKKFIENTQKVHAGHKQLFLSRRDVLNSDEPIFAVEGYIDAMSIELAGFKAVAFGGRGDFRLLVNAVAVKEKKPSIILLFDPDKPGRDYAPKAFDDLRGVGCPAVIRFLTDEESKLDCNEILTTSGVEALRDKLQDIYDNSLSELAAVAEELEKEKSEELPADTNPEKIIADVRDRCEWKHDKEGNKTTIKATQKTLDLIFSEDPNLRGLVGYNQFQDTYSFLKKAPWHSENTSTSGQWRDSDAAELRGYIRRNYADLKDKVGIEDTLIHFANKNAFHPVKQYFYNLPRWDGTKRAEKIFIDFLDADDTPQTREVTLNWLLAAVARIFRPGCRYQTALVLHGNQGIGKSYLPERLGGKWHSSINDNVSDPHAIDALQNIWIGEFKEMAAMRKEDVNQVKSFIERKSDNRRPPYARYAVDTPRHCVFVVTVNDEGFLRDQTGNRRFLVIHCNRPKFGYVEGLTDEYIAQVWAEVFQIFNATLKNLDDNELGKRLELRHETKNDMEAIAERYVQDDGMTAEIKAHLEKKIPEKIIWKLLPKDARRKFFVDGKITIEEGDLDALFKTKSGKITPEKQAAFNEAKVECDSVRREYISRNDGMPLYLTFYGREQRNHICAAEIFNECFANGDKRKAMYRINEILSKLEGWQLGDRNELRNADPEYPEQRKPYFRQIADKR